MVAFIQTAFNPSGSSLSEPQTNTVRGLTGLPNHAHLVDVREACTAKNLWVKASSNSMVGSSTIRLQKNSTNGNGTLSIAGGATGTFEDTSNTDSFSQGDAINYTVTMAAEAGTQSINFQAFSILLDEATPVSSCVANGANTYGGDSFTTIQGNHGGNSTSGNESNCSRKMRTATTMSRMYVRVAANTSTAATIRLRKNGSNGNQNVSISSGATGEFEDVSNSDSISAGDLVCTQVDLTSGSSIQITAIAYRMTDVGVLMNAVSNGTNFTTQRYAPLTGDLSNNTTTEADTQIKARAASAFKNLFVTNNNSSQTGTVSVTLRKNGADVITVSISSGASGYFEETSTTVQITNTDLLNYRIDGSVGGTFRPSSVSVEQIQGSSVAHSAEAALTGAGTVAADGKVGAQAAAALAGAGTVAAAGSHGAIAQAALAGQGTVAADGRAGALGAAVLAGIATVAATAPAAYAGAAALAGAGIVAADGTAGHNAASALSGIGSFVPITPPLLAEAALAGIGTLSPTALHAALAAAALTGAGSVAAAAAIGRGGAAALTGVATVAAAASYGARGATVLTGVGIVSATATLVVFVVLPTRLRPRVFIHDGASLRRLAQLTAVTDINRSYALWEHVRTATFSLAITDPAIDYTNPDDANVVVIESSEYPLPFVGRIIDQEGDEAGRTVTITADSIDTILAERTLPADFTTPPSVRLAVARILATTNGINDTGIGVDLSRVEEIAAPAMALSNVTPLDALNKLAENAGLEWWLAFKVTPEGIGIAVNMMRERGADLSAHVALMQPGNYKVTRWRRNGRAVAYAQTVVAGESSPTEGFTERDRSVAVRDRQGLRDDGARQIVVEAQRALAFGHAINGSGSFKAPTRRRELTAIREELRTAGESGAAAAALLLKRRMSERIVQGRVYPDTEGDPAESWKYLEPGNVIYIGSATAFLRGYSGVARVLGVQPMEHQRFMELVLEVQ